MIDFPLVLGRLRPTSEYQWLGDDPNNQQYSDIGEWRDPSTIKPTEQECVAEWNVYLAEVAVAEAEQQAKDDAQTDIDARFLLSQLANKTPAEIYTLMQTRMDAWATLADARADLRDWLPLMAAVMSWKVQK